MKDKYKSRKFLVTLWAIIIFTFIVVYSMITKFVPDYAAFVLPSLIGIIISWVGSETFLKRYNSIVSSNSTETKEKIEEPKVIGKVKSNSSNKLGK